MRRVIACLMVRLACRRRGPSSFAALHRTELDATDHVAPRLSDRARRARHEQPATLIALELPHAGRIEAGGHGESSSATDRLSQARGGDRLIRHRRERRRVLALDRPGWTERNPPPATTGRSRATKRRAAPTRARQRPSATIGFCDDFERATLLGSWTEASSAGGTLAIVGAPGFKYLEGEVAGRDAGAAAVAVLRKDFSATVTRVSLECDLAYDRRPTISNDGVIILKIKSATANAFQLIYLNVRADKSGFVLQDPSLAGGIEYRNIPFESGSRRVASRSTWRWRAERACASTAR